MLRQRGVTVVDNEAWMRQNWFPQNEDEYLKWILESMLRPLAAKFRVSLQAMRIRLEELGLLIKTSPALAM